ncbi:MAG TPA: TMEM175 family protein [Puia sp.]|nr:TMEM175 family protein [Puia sp.]
MIRKLLTGRPRREGGFRHRGHEIQRIETFSDAVFAFAITLLIVSLEVPKTFDELLTSIRGFVAFGICFTFLFIIWNEQHVFFRRYGMEDKTTLFLNAVLLFIVLFYVYPLKFLFSLLLGGNTGGAVRPIREEQIPQLMIIYSVGYIVIYVVFLLLYLHAFRRRGRLELTNLEVFDTRSRIWSHAIQIIIGATSMLTALILPARVGGLAGWVYPLIGPVLWIFYARRARRRWKIGR